MSKVIITVKKGGKTTVEVKGVPGVDCLKASAPYIQALGQPVAQQETEEMHLPPLSEQQRLNQ